MLLSIVEIVLPLVLVVLITIPLIAVFRGKVDKRSAKIRLITHVCGFFAIVCGTLVATMVFGPSIFGAEGDAVISDMSKGLGYLSAAIATGLGSIGAGIAVAAAAPAAIGAFSENSKNFGKSLIFVALGEGVAIYGLLISILIINNLG